MSVTQMMIARRALLAIKDSDLASIVGDPDLIYESILPIMSPPAILHPLLLLPIERDNVRDAAEI